MNKIYKVIYNKARNCYVVASEIAKSTSKSTSGSKKKAAALLCAAVLSGGLSASAADLPSVTYDDDTKARITLGSGSSTVEIVGVTGGQVFSGSTYAANGNDVYKVNQRISSFQSRLDTVDDTVSTINSTVAGHSTDINSLKNSTATLSQKIERGYNFQVNGFTVKNATPGSNNVNFESGNHVTVANDAGSIKFSINDNGTVTAGNKEYVTGDTVNTAIEAEKTARTKVDTDLSTRIGTIDNDGTYVKKANSVSANLSNLDAQVKKNADAITAEATTRANEIKKAKDELSNSITNLDSNAVKYDDTTKAKITLGTGSIKTTITNLNDATLSATSTDAVTGKQLFATNANVTKEIKDREDAIAKEVTDRNAAIKTETDARVAADKTITDKLGTLADGTYIKASGTFASNLIALDTQVKNNKNAIDAETAARDAADKALESKINTTLTGLSNNAVKYDNDKKTLITLDGAGGTVISNVKAGTLSDTSTEAVNGAQLNATNTKLANEITARTNAIGSMDRDGAYVTAKGSVSANLTALDTQVKANADAITKEKTDRDTAIKNMKDEITGSIDSLTDNAVKYKEGSGKSLVELGGVEGTKITNLKDATLSTTSTDAVTGRQLNQTNTDLANEIQARKDAIAQEVTDRNAAIKSETDARVAADKAINDKLGSMTKDGSYILAQGTVASNLTALDTQVRANADAITKEKTDRDAAIKNMKDEITGSIDSLTDNAVKYKEGSSKSIVELGGVEGTKITNLKDATLSTTSTDAVTGRQLNQTNTNLTNEIQARKDAIAQEVTDRNAAIKSETDARVAADKAINDKLGSMTKDGSYILAQGTVASNLTALDTQVKANANAIGKEKTDREAAITNLKTEITNNINSLSGNAVQYKDDTKGEVELTGKNGTIISGVKAGKLSADSTEAVNGAQLNQTNTNLTNEIQARKDAITKEVTDRDAAIKTAVKAEADARTADVNDIKGKIGTIAKDGSYIVANDTVSNNLGKLDTGVKANKDAIDAEVAARKDANTVLETKINNTINNLSNNAVQYTDATKDTVKLGGAKGTVITNVKAGALTADSVEAVNGSQLFESNRRITTNSASINTINTSLSSLRSTVNENTESIQGLSTRMTNLNNQISKTITSLTSLVDSNANQDLSNISQNGTEAITAVANKAIENYMQTYKKSLAAQSNDVSTMMATYASPVATQATTEAVVYDDEKKTRITLGENKNTVDIVGVTGGQVYEGSTYAATGNDVYKVSQRITSFQSRLDTVDDTVATMNATVSGNSVDINALKTSTTTLNQKLDRGYAFKIDGNTVKTATPADNVLNFKPGDNVAITDDNGSIKISAEGTGVIGKGNSGLISGDTAYKALEEKANKDLSNLTEEAKNQIKNSVSADLSGKANVSLDNLSEAGIQKVKDIMSTDMKLKADTSLSNLTTDGVNQIKKLARSSVKLVDGNGTKVSSTYDKNGNISYAVNINTGDIAQGGTGFVTADAVKAALATKANLDASNIDAGKYAEKLGTGIITDGDTNLVTGGTVYNAIKNLSGGAGGLITKVDVDMSNVSSEGKTVIKNLAKEAVKVADGKYTTVSSETDNDGNITYRVNVTADGTIEDENTGLITGDTAKKALDTKANTDLDNITDAGKNVIKDTMKDDLDKKADKDLSNLTEEAKNQIKNTMAADLEGKANIDASNVGKYATEWASALGTGKIEKGNKNLVTGDMVYSAVSVKADKSYVDEELAKKANTDDVNTALAGKANNDLSNITDAGKNVIKNTMKADMDKKADKDYVDTALAGKVDKSDFDTVKNQVDKNTADIATKADKSYVDNELSKKADADKVYTKEETDAKIDSKIDSVKDAINGDLENKVNKDASNIEKEKWQEALGDGVNEAGNKGLINGDTLHTALDDLKKDGVGLVKQDGDTIKVGSDSDATKVDFKGTDKDGNSIDRVLTGIKTDENDMSSAANVGYIQGVASGLENQMDYMNSRLTNDIKNAGAVASALAGLHHIDYDPDNKLDFAVSTAAYRGKSAAALGAFYQPNENVMFSLAGTIGSSHNAWNAGVSFKIGHGSDAPVLSRRVLGNRITALAQQNQYLADRNEKLEQDVRDMQNKLNALLAAIDVSKDVQKDMTAPATK